jgi:hypothetical protein
MAPANPPKHCVNGIWLHVVQFRSALRDDDGLFPAREIEIFEKGFWKKLPQGDSIHRSSSQRTAVREGSGFS